MTVQAAFIPSVLFGSWYPDYLERHDSGWGSHMKFSDLKAKQHEAGRGYSPWCHQQPSRLHVNENKKKEKSPLWFCIIKLAIPGKVEMRWVNTSSKSTDAIRAENLRQMLCDHFPFNISYLLILLVGLGRSVSWIAMHPLVMVRLAVQWQG